MIDPNKCEFEESFDLDDGSTVFYFTYPKDMDETEFYAEKDYGNVVCMCISVTVMSGDDCYVQISPTIEFDVKDVTYKCDVDWRDLYKGINYDDRTVVMLLNKAIG